MKDATVNELIRRYRKKYSLHQKQLGKLIAYNHSVISRVENNEILPSEDFVTSFIESVLTTPSEATILWNAFMRDTERSPQIHWGKAPTNQHMFGRSAEIERISKWILSDQIQLVSILGLGGAGKTLLASYVTKNILHDFEFVYWTDVVNAPTLSYLLQEFFEFVSSDALITDNVSRFIQIITNFRCLMIIDNVETLLDHLRPGYMRRGREDFEGFFRLLCETTHRSSVLITSREAINAIQDLEGSSSAARSVYLPRLPIKNCLQIMKDKGLKSVEVDGKNLAKLYSGNPLAIGIVSSLIAIVYRNDIGVYLEQGQSIFGRLQDVLEEQFERLTNTENAVILWLTIKREDVTIRKLQYCLEPGYSWDEIALALKALGQRSLIEETSTGFNVQNLIREFLTDKFVNLIVKEIQEGQLNYYHSHCLMEATAHEFIRETQEFLIVDQVVEKLMQLHGNLSILRGILTNIIKQLGQEQISDGSYAAGNSINLISKSGLSLSGFDFSRLPIRQAYLQNAILHDVDFSAAVFRETRLRKTFGIISCSIFSKSGDYFVFGTADGEVRVWNTEFWSEIAVFKAHSDWVRCIDVNDEGSLIASGGTDHLIKVWNVQDGSLQLTLRGHQNRVRSVKFSHDSSLLISSSDDETVRVWDSNTGELKTKLHCHLAWVTDIALHPSLPTIASTSADGSVVLCDYSDDSHYYTLQHRRDSDPLTCVDFSNDGSLLAVSGYSGVVRVWNIQSRQMIGEFQAHGKRIWSIKFDPTGTQLATCSDDKTVKLWDLDNFALDSVLEGHINQVRTISFEHNTQLLATGGADQIINIWNLKGTKRCIHSFQGYNKPIRSVAISRNTEFLAIGGDDEKVGIWRYNTANPMYNLSGHTNRIWSVAFSPVEAIIASGSDDMTIRIWDVHNKRDLTIIRDYQNQISSVDFNYDGQILAGSSSDRTIKLWNPYTGEYILSLQDNPVWTLSIAFHPSKNILVGGGSDQLIRIWDANSGKLLHVLRGHTGRVWSVQFNGSGTLLVSGSDDQTVKLWDLDSLSCIRTFRGHSDRVWCVDFNRVGTHIASGSGDTTLRIWQIEDGNYEILRGHYSWVRSLSWKKTDPNLVSSSNDGEVIIWDSHLGESSRRIRPARPYEGMRINEISGLSESEVLSLRMLGAIES